jgi:DNA polymerase III alpha subunit
LIENDKVIFVRGRVDRRREKPNVVASELLRPEEAGEKIATKVRIDIDAMGVTAESVAKIKSICLHHKGKSPVYVAVHTDKGRVFAAADKGLAVTPDIEFCKKIKHVAGTRSVQLTT